MLAAVTPRKHPGPPGASDDPVGTAEATLVAGEADAVAVGSEPVVSGHRGAAPGTADAIAAVDHSAPTLIARRGRRVSGSAGASGTGTSGSQPDVASPQDALAMEEVERTRVFASLLVFVDAFGLITLPFLGGNDVLRWLLIGAMAINLVAAAWPVEHLRRARPTATGPLVALAAFA